ncbi:MAG TPA: uroporphyrinogen decarboxylase [Bacteroidales bacterium]|nr:uroporphyrinogen decarboxylase [Bacteroidales bacterium]
MQNSIFLDTLQGKKTSRPPVWFMRQAGRVLPSYLELRVKHSFWEMLSDPSLAAKVTLLPVHDLEVDAAILFSDILVIPYAMGMGLEFTDYGPKFDKPLMNFENPVTKLNPDAGKLQFIYKTIDEIVKIRPESTPLIGFAGAPLTVLCYMLEGLSSKAGFPDAISFIYRNKNITEKLIDEITDLTIEYSLQQIAHGIDAFQLFETHGGILPFEFYMAKFFPAIQKISKAVRDKGIPFIFFPKDIGTGYSHISPDICDFVSIDWQTPIIDARKMVHPSVGLQGNLDPRFLFADQIAIEEELVKYIEFGKKEYKWIFNLGHGFIPGIPFENAKYVTDWVKSTNWRR